MIGKRTYDNALHEDACVWRWREIFDGDDPEVYLTRLLVTRFKKLGGILIHWIHRPDRARDLHDHPWWFVSIVLRGWYEEEVFEKAQLNYRPVQLLATRVRRIRWINFKRAKDMHRISRVPKNCVTLVIHGPRSRTWGFLSFAHLGWVDWKTYLGIEGRKAAKDAS